MQYSGKCSLLTGALFEIRLVIRKLESVKRCGIYLISCNAEVVPWCWMT